MPRVNIPITQITRAGVAQPAQVLSDIVNLHSIAYNTGGIVLECQNTHATLARNVIIETPGIVDGNAIADLTVSVAATSTKLIGPFPPAIYTQPDTTVYIDVDGVSNDVKFRAYQVA